MPICTYFDDFEVKEHKENLNDSEIQELLDYINKKSKRGTKLFVAKREFYRRHWFRRADVVVRYELYSWLQYNEYQLVNFASDEAETSLYTTVSRRDILNFLMGWSNGLDCAKCRK